jgi:lipid A 3-O-deacylase
MALVVAASSSAHAQKAPLDLGPIQILGAEPNYLDVAFGGYSLDEHYETSQTYAGRAEIRFAGKLFYIGPTFGVMVEGHGGADFFGGFYTDVKVGPFILRPLAAVSAYLPGNNDKNLGGTFEFREEFTAAYRFHNYSELGVMIAHISSADVNRYNPGENELMVTYSLPIRF